MISESFYTESMTYQNCGGGHDDNFTASSSKQVKPLSPVNKLKRIVAGRGKEVKAKIKELIMQYK